MALGGLASPYNVPLLSSLNSLETTNPSSLSRVVLASNGGGTAAWEW